MANDEGSSHPKQNPCYYVALATGRLTMEEGSQNRRPEGRPW